MVEKDLGFVLRRYNFRETSLIASLFTLNFGKIVGIFKGFYTQKKEFSSPLDICTLNEFVFYPKRREIWLVSSADLLEDYPFMRRDFSKSKLAVGLASLIEHALPLWERSREVFFLFKETLNQLPQRDEKKVLYVFLIKFLGLSGFKPYLEHCLFCHQTLDLKEDIFFSISRGGLICKNCSGRTTARHRISGETNSLLAYIQKNGFSLGLRLYFSKDAEREIDFLLNGFLEYHLEFRLAKLL